MFITFEGIEGIGKSTQLRVVADYLKNENIPHCLTREPGGTPLGENIRALFLQNYDVPMTPMAELLLMFAARSQHVESVIKPALGAGKWVLCDRFVDATYAYQGSGRGIEGRHIEALEHLVLEHFQPDHVFLLDAPVEVGYARMSKRRELDRVEQEKMDFFERVRQGYLKRAQDNLNRYHIIDASQPLKAVSQKVLELIQQWI